MPVKHVREGKLTPYRDQELFWIVPNQWAAARGRGGMVEIFRATPHKSYASGFIQTFAFTYYDFEDMQRVLPNLLVATRDMERECNKALHVYAVNARANDLYAGGRIDNTFTGSFLPAIT